MFFFFNFSHLLCLKPSFLNTGMWVLITLFGNKSQSSVLFGLIASNAVAMSKAAAGEYIVARFLHCFAYENYLACLYA